jgi:hypothetical protein
MTSIATLTNLCARCGTNVGADSNIAASRRATIDIALTATLSNMVTFVIVVLAEPYDCILCVTDCWQVIASATLIAGGVLPTVIAAVPTLPWCRRLIQSSAPQKDRQRNAAFRARLA